MTELELEEAEEALQKQCDICAIKHIRKSEISDSFVACITKYGPPYIRHMYGWTNNQCSGKLPLILKRSVRKVRSL
jgi:hypothetical protein